ncbi:MAG: hypothetical protein P4L86_03470 [Mycobacterium sp.]|nr:hypothetical protein [Mycobacterium sp.]
MTIRRHVAALASIPALAAACSQVEPPGMPDRAAPAAVAQNFDQIPRQYPPQAAGIPGAAIAPVGACVSFDGPSTNATLKVVDCGSPTNGYKVIQRVSTPDQCPKDVDQKFYMNPAEGQFTACLDYAWSAKDCLSIGKVTAVRVACNDAGAPDRQKPLNVVLDSINASDCPETGFPHPVRRFTVCAERQK